MRTKGETALAVWCGLLVGTALGFVATGVGWHQGSLPVWTDPFYSGWAQSIGAVVAVIAAFRVGRNQVLADAQQRARDRADEHRLALHIGYAALSDCLASAKLIAIDKDPANATNRKRWMVQDLEAAYDDFRDILRMHLPMQTRAKAMGARFWIDKRLGVHRLFADRLEQVELDDLQKDLPTLEQLFDWFGEAMAAAEKAELQWR